MNITTNSINIPPVNTDLDQNSPEKIGIRIVNEERKIDYLHTVSKHILIKKLAKTIAFLLKVKYSITDCNDCVFTWNNQILDEEKHLSDYDITSQSIVNIDFTSSKPISPISTSDIVLSRVDIKSDLYKEIKGYILANNYEAVYSLISTNKEDISYLETVTKILSSLSKACTLDLFCFTILDFIVKQKYPDTIMIESIRWFQGMTSSLPNTNLCISVIDMCFTIFLYFSSNSVILQTARLLRNILTTNVSEDICLYVLDLDIKDESSLLLGLLNTYIQSPDILSDLFLSITHLTQNSKQYSQSIVSIPCFTILYKILSKYYQNKEIIKNAYTVLLQTLSFQNSGYCMYKSRIFEQILFILQFNDEFILTRTLSLLSTMGTYNYINCYIFYYKMVASFLKILTSFESNKDILLYGILLFRNIAIDNERCIYLLNEGVLDFLVHQLGSVNDKIYIVNNINTIRNIVSHSPLCQDYLLSTNILMVLLTITSSYQDDKDICKQICLCYQEIAKTSKGRDCLLNMNISSTLDTYMDIFKEDSDIKSQLLQLKTILKQDNVQENSLYRLNSVSTLDAKTPINIKFRSRPIRRGVSNTPKLPILQSNNSSDSKDTSSLYYSAETENSSIQSHISPPPLITADHLRTSSEGSLLSTLSSSSHLLTSLSSAQNYIPNQSNDSLNIGMDNDTENLEAVYTDREIDIGNRFGDVPVLDSGRPSNITPSLTPINSSYIDINNDSNNNTIENKDLLSPNNTISSANQGNLFDLTALTPSVAQMKNRSIFNSKTISIENDTTNEMNTNGDDLLVWALVNLRKSSNEEEIISFISMLKVFIWKEKSLSLPYVRHVRYIPRYISYQLSKFDHNEKMHLIGIEVICAFSEDISTTKYLESGETIEIMNKDLTTYINNIKIITPILTTFTVLSNMKSLQERLVSISTNITLNELLHNTVNPEIKIAANTILTNLGLQSDEKTPTTQDDLEIELNSNIMEIVLEQLKRGNRNTKMTVLFVLSQLFYDRCDWTLDEFFSQNGIALLLDIMKQYYNEKDIIQRGIDVFYSLSQIDKALKKLEFANVLEGLLAVISVYKDNAHVICSTVATICNLCKLDSILSRLTTNLVVLNTLLTNYVYKDKNENNDTLKLYANICDYIIRIYVSIIKDGKTNHLRLNTDIIDTVIYSIKKFKDISSVQAACSFLHILSTESQLTDKLRLSDSINVLLSTAINTISNEDPDQLIELLDTAGSIAQMSNTNMCHFANVQGFRVIETVLESIENDRVINTCINVIRNLTLTEIISRDILNTKVLDQLVNCMNRANKKKNVEIIENCCAAIHNLAATSNDICNALIELNVPSLLASILGTFTDNIDIVYQCSWAIHEFAERDVSESLFPPTTAFLLQQLLNQYTGSIDVVVKIKLALSSLKNEDIGFNEVPSLLPGSYGMPATRRSSINNVCTSLTSLYNDNLTEDSVITTLKALETLCVKDTVRKDIVENGAISILCIAYNKFPQNEEIVRTLCSIFYFISSDDHFCDSLCDNNIISLLCQILSYYANQNIILQCLRIINNLCATRKNCAAIVQGSLIGICIDKMYNYKNIEIFVEVGVNILYQIALLYDINCLSFYSLSGMLSDFILTVHENLSLLIRIDILLYKMKEIEGEIESPNYSLVIRVVDQIKKQIIDSNEYNNIRQNIVVLTEREEYRVKLIELDVITLLNKGYQKYNDQPTVVSHYLEALTAITSGDSWRTQLNNTTMHNNIFNILKTTKNVNLYRKAIYCLVNLVPNHECRQFYFDNKMIPVIIGTIPFVSKSTDIVENILIIITYIIQDSQCPDDILDLCVKTIFDLLYKQYTSDDICKTVLALFKLDTNNGQLHTCIYKYAPKSLLDTFSVSISKNASIQNTLDLLTNFATSTENVDLLIQNNINELLYSLLCRYTQAEIILPILNAYIYFCHYKNFLKCVQANNDIVKRLNSLISLQALNLEVVSLCQSLLNLLVNNLFKPLPPKDLNDFDIGPLPSFDPPSIFDEDFMTQDHPILSTIPINNTIINTTTNNNTTNTTTTAPATTTTAPATTNTTTTDNNNNNNSTISHPTHSNVIMIPRSGTYNQSHALARDHPSQLATIPVTPVSDVASESILSQHTTEPSSTSISTEITSENPTTHSQSNSQESLSSPRLNSPLRGPSFFDSNNSLPKSPKVRLTPRIIIPSSSKMTANHNTDKSIVSPTTPVTGMNNSTTTIDTDISKSMSPNDSSSPIKSSNKPMLTISRSIKKSKTIVIPSTKSSIDTSMSLESPRMNTSINDIEESETSLNTSVHELPDSLNTVSNNSEINKQRNVPSSIHVPSTKGRTLLIPSSSTKKKENIESK